MAIWTDALRTRLQQEVDDLFSGELTVKLHTANPQLDPTAHLAYGTGLPQLYSFEDDEPVTFTVPDYIPDTRPWWKRLFTRCPTAITFAAVSLWRDALPLSSTPLQPSITVSAEASLYVDITKPEVREALG